MAAVYGGVSFVVLQLADIIFPNLGLPDWALTFVVALLLLGFPIALVLAWAFEMTPEGVKRADPAASWRRSWRCPAAHVGRPGCWR